jgi:hypothetical protein
MPDLVLINGTPRRLITFSIPSQTTRSQTLRLFDLLHEVREVEMMLVGAGLLPSNLDCQMHICKLVAGRVPSLEKPSSKALGFVVEFDKHIETRKRYDAWKEKESKEPKSERQVNPDCVPQ